MLTLTINEAIAGELGYRIEDVPYEGEPVTNTDNYKHFLIAPDGTRMQFSSAAKAIQSLPDWEHSFDAALALPIPDDVDVLMSSHHKYDRKMVSAELWDDRGLNQLAYSESSNSMAEAICLAWLTYRKGVTLAADK